MAIENFIREKPDNPKEGQILWEASFIDTPYFQQYLRNPEQAGMQIMMNELFDAGLGGFMGHGAGLWHDDDHFSARPRSTRAPRPSPLIARRCREAPPPHPHPHPRRSSALASLQ